MLIANLFAELEKP